MPDNAEPRSGAVPALRRRALRAAARAFAALSLAAGAAGLLLIWTPPRTAAPARDAHPFEESAPTAGHAPRGAIRPARRPDPRPGVTIASPIDAILVEKAARRMTVWQRSGPPGSFAIALGFAPSGDKRRQGDGRTPEGSFRIDRVNRDSAFHRALGIDYPQPRHRDAARRAGVDPGGDIMIHGQPRQVPPGWKIPGDWTAGCIALDNAAMDQLFAHAAPGTPVEIRP